jgi:hypothetical protein
MERILEQGPLEGLADLRVSKISILEDVLIWLWKKILLDFNPAESGRLVSSPSPRGQGIITMKKLRCSLGLQWK